jgi:hypothetical protein
MIVIRSIIYLKMRQNKGHFKALNQRTFLYGFLLLILGLINPEIPELRANVCPENLITKVYPVDIFKVSFSNFKTFGVKQDVPVHPLTKKHSTNNTSSQPPSDQCYFKEGHRLIADRGPETALLTFSGIFSGYPLNTISFISHLPFVIFSSGNGNSLKIRPPPIF